MNEKKGNKNQLIKVAILVVALMVLAFSGTYAFFTTNFIGEPSTTSAKSGVFKIESSLERTNVLKNKKMILIDEEEKEQKAEKLNFTVTNKNDSTVDGSIAIFLKDITLSKNLYSKYLKWELLKENELISSGDFESAVRMDEEISGEEENTITNVEDIQLVANISIPKNTTTSYVFRMYLLNDKNQNQIELTNGHFSGRLYLEAVPVSEMNSK